MVFAGSQEQARQLSDPLRTVLWGDHKISVLLPEGTEPIKALHSFRDNKTTLLLATPAAARGLDLPAVRCGLGRRHAPACVVSLCCACDPHHAVPVIHAISGPGPPARASDLVMLVLHVLLVLLQPRIQHRAAAQPHRLPAPRWALGAHRVRSAGWVHTAACLLAWQGSWEGSWRGSCATARLC